MTKEIQLTQGKVALVDDEDYARASQNKWRSLRGDKTFYAIRNGPRPRRETIYLHREIIGACPGEEVDHMNGDGLDNRRTNMRISTRAENSRNQSGHNDNTSGLKGVSWDKGAGKWLARIMVNGKAIHLGLFDDLIAAARAYDAAARKHHSEFARTNF